jgi:hypothetical protein
VANNKEYYKGEGGGFPIVRVMVNLVSLCLFVFVRVCSWFVRAPKMFQLCTNQLIILFVWFV